MIEITVVSLVQCSLLEEKIGGLAMTVAVSPFNTGIHYECCGTCFLFPYRRFWTQELETKVHMTKLLQLVQSFHHFFFLSNFQSVNIWRRHQIMMKMNWSGLFFLLHIPTSSIVSTINLDGDHCLFLMGVEIWKTIWKSSGSLAERRFNELTLKEKLYPSMISF